MRRSLKLLVVFGSTGIVLTGISTVFPISLAMAPNVELAYRFNFFEDHHREYEPLFPKIECTENDAGGFDCLEFANSKEWENTGRMLEAVRAGRKYDWTCFDSKAGGLPFRSAVFAFNTLNEVGGSSQGHCKFERIRFYRFLWWGILGNVAVFGLFALAIHSSWCRARRWMRDRRSRGNRFCANCGYSLYGLPSRVCPECGTKAAEAARSQEA